MKEISWTNLKKLAAGYKATKGREKENYILPYGLVKVYNKKSNEGFAVSDRNPPRNGNE